MAHLNGNQEIRKSITTDKSEQYRMVGRVSVPDEPHKLQKDPKTEGLNLHGTFLPQITEPCKTSRLGE